MWTRTDLWAEHDARHARRLRAQAIVLVAALLALWNVLAALSYLPQRPARELPSRCSSGGPALSPSVR